MPSSFLFSAGGSNFILNEDQIWSVLMMRRARQDAFGEDLFSDPAWDILLILYAGELGSRKVSIAELTRALGAPPSVIARWIAKLRADGFVVALPTSTSSTDPKVTLSVEGLKRMDRLAQNWASAFVTIESDLKKPSEPDPKK